MTGEVILASDATNSKQYLRNRLAPASVARHMATTSYQNLAVPAGLALVANSLCRGQERRKIHERGVQIENSGHNAFPSERDEVLGVAEINEKTQHLQRRLRVSGVLIILGLVVEALSLVRIHPLAFLAFMFVGGAFLLAGIATYLYSLVS